MSSDYAGNCYELLSQVRYGLQEHSDAYVQGTDTSGAFKNPELIRHINNAQYFIWSALYGQFPEFFLTSASLTFTASVATLPTDCFKIREIVDSDGYPIRPINMGKRHVNSATGSEHAYYRYGNTVRIDADGVSQTATLWYYSRCRELDTGMTSAGGALSATLATTAKAIADYYNNMKIENITDATNDTITVYSVARVATVSNTWAASKYYGIISDLPELFHPLIASRALLTLKQLPRSPVQITVADLTLFNDELRAALQLFAGSLHGDTDYNELFNDFEPHF